MTRILVIDDDAQIRGMLKFMFEEAGYEVMTAPEGEAAMKLHHETPADLVVTDILMPGKEGVETIIGLRKESPAIKIIAISGGGAVGSQVYLDLAKKFGVHRTFAKPLDLKELLESVRELVRTD